MSQAFIAGIAIQEIQQIMRIQSALNSIGGAAVIGFGGGELTFDDFMSLSILQADTQYYNIQG